MSKTNIKEKLLKTFQLHGKTGGEDVFQNFYTILLEINEPFHKLASIVTDGGALTVTNKNVA
jgi:hypothetical protein